MDQELADKLDTIILLLNLAFADPIERARAAVLADPVKAAITHALGAAPLDAAHLQAAVKEATGQSERTVVRRVSELVAQGMVVRFGSGARVQYRLGGLLGGSPSGNGRTPARG